MTAVELTPTLRAHLDALDPYLEDPSVSEILVAGPERVFVTRDGTSEKVDLALPEARLRSMADRLLRAIGPRSRAATGEVQVGRIGGLEITIIGPPRGARCPIVRVVRSAASAYTIDALVDDDTIAEALREAPEARASVLCTGPHGAPRLDLVIAMLGEWAAHGRVLALDTEDGPLATSGAADLVLEPDVGIGAILAVAADVVVAFDPAPGTWADLLAAGRPVVASIEAPDADTALSRVMARVLAGRAELSRAAAEALVESSFSIVAELNADPGAPAVARVGRAEFRGGRLEFAAVGSQRPGRAPVTTDLPVVRSAPITANLPSAARDVLSSASTPELPIPDRAEEEVMLDLLPEDLVSKSFVHELDDGGLAASIVDPDVDDIDETATADVGDATPAFAVRVPAVLDVPDSRVMAETDEEDRTQFAPDPKPLDERTSLDPEDPLIDGEVMAAFDEAMEAVEAVEHQSLGDADALDDDDDATNDADAADDEEPFDEEPFDEMQTDDEPRARRVPNERTPTEIGPPNGSEGGSAWAARAYRAAAGVGEVHIPEDAHRDLSSPFERPEEHDVRTSTHERMPSLDPFDALDADTALGDARDASERTLGVGHMMPSGVADEVYDSRIRDPSVHDVYDSRAHVQAEDVGPRLGSGLVSEDADADWDAEGPSLIIDGPPALARRDDPDRTRAGKLEAEATAPVPKRSTRRPRSAQDGASKDRDAQEDRRPVRRKPPGRSLD